MPGLLAPLPTAGDNPGGLSTATAAEGAFLMAPDFHPWITRIDPNYGQPAWSPWALLTTLGLEQPWGWFLAG